MSLDCAVWIGKVRERSAEAVLRDCAFFDISDEARASVLDEGFDIISVSLRELFGVPGNCLLDVDRVVERERDRERDDGAILSEK